MSLNVCTYCLDGFHESCDVPMQVSSAMSHGWCSEQCMDQHYAGCNTASNVIAAGCKVAGCKLHLVKASIDVHLLLAPAELYKSKARA